VVRTGQEIPAGRSLYARSRTEMARQACLKRRVRRENVSFCCQSCLGAGRTSWREEAIGRASSRPSSAWSQPRHNDVMWRSSAARQKVALHGDLRKGARLLTRLPFLARKRHPFANNRASRVRLGHVDLLFENAAVGPSRALHGIPPPPPIPPAIAVTPPVAADSFAGAAPRCAAAPMHGRRLDDEVAVLP
jgi:hypothetical protein